MARVDISNPSILQIASRHDTIIFHEIKASHQIKKINALPEIRAEEVNLQKNFPKSYSDNLRVSPDLRGRNK